MKKTGLAMGILFLANLFGQTVLSGPIGARSIAMGSCGYSLYDDETALFYNPAGLGLKNDRWNGGAFCYSSLNSYGFKGSYYGMAYQNDNLPRLGFASYLNRFGNVNSPYGNYENVVSTGVGYNFYSNDFLSHAVGTTVKYYDYHYNLGSWREEEHMSPVAIDAGYAAQIANRIRLGLVLKNLGPDLTIKVNDSTLYSFPLPYIIAAGCGYKDAFNSQNLRVLDLSAGISYASIFQNHNTSDNEIQTGIDMSFFRIFSLQLGYSNDLTNNSYNLSWGTGIDLFNHFEFNLYWQGHVEQHFEGYLVPNSQIESGISMAFKRMLNWSAKDRRWWLD